MLYLLFLLLELICPAKSVFSFDYSQHIVDSFHLFIKLFELCDIHLNVLNSFVVYFYLRKYLIYRDR
jgi:hypothetical protein